MTTLPIHGIIPPVVTPLVNDNELDEPGLQKLIDHLLGGGVHGLFLLGTTGEATSLSYSLRERFVRMACEMVAGRVPVMAGITDTSFTCAVEMAHAYKEAGADLLVTAPPYYFPITQEEMCRYLDELVSELPLPFLLYNMPSHTKLHMSVDTVKHAQDLGACGIKDSSGDMLFFYSLLDAFKESRDFAVITGVELFIPEAIIQGGHGAIAGGANLFPGLFVEIYNAARQNDKVKINFLRQIIFKIYQTIYNVSTFSSRYTVGTKCALAAMEICNDYVARPLYIADHVDRAAVRLYVEEIKEMMAKTVITKT